MAFTYTGEMVDLGFGRGWLNRPAASSVFRIDRQLGHALQITEAGRTWGKQNEHYQTYLRVGYPIALNPDTPSIHQKGGAIDSNEAQRIVAILEDHGWRRTVYRWVNGVWTLVEPWHFEYFEHLDNHRFEGSPAGAQEDDMDISELYQWRRDMKGAPEPYNVLDGVAYVAQRQEDINARDEARHGQTRGLVSDTLTAAQWVNRRQEEINARDEQRHAETRTMIAALTEAVKVTSGGQLSTDGMQQIVDAAQAAAREGAEAAVAAAHQAEMAKLDQIHQEQIAERDRELAGLRAQLAAAG